MAAVGISLVVLSLLVGAETKNNFRDSINRHTSRGALCLRRNSNPMYLPRATGYIPPDIPTVLHPYCVICLHGVGTPPKKGLGVLYENVARLSRHRST